DEIGVAEVAHRARAIDFAPRPQVAARETAEHGRASGVEAFALQRVEDFLDGVHAGNRILNPLFCQRRGPAVAVSCVPESGNRKMLQREPPPALRPFVSTLWAGEPVVGGPAFRERVLPGGASVGAELRAGACMALFGVPADTLAERHTLLKDLWGADAMHACDRVFSARSAATQLDAFAEISPRGSRACTGCTRQSRRHSRASANRRTCTRWWRPGATAIGTSSPCSNAKPD